jgi:hypothetical protein
MATETGAAGAAALGTGAALFVEHPQISGTSIKIQQEFDFQTFLIMTRIIAEPPVQGRARVDFVFLECTLVDILPAH